MRNRKSTRFSKRKEEQPKFYPIGGTKIRMLSDEKIKAFREGIFNNPYANAIRLDVKQ